MTEQLKELIGLIRVRLNDAGFMEISSAGKFPRPSGIRQS
jgi:hypothetical protein